MDRGSLARRPDLPSRRRFLGRAAALGASALLAGAGFAWARPWTLEVHEVALPVAGLPAPFEGYRIALVSDLHVVPHTPRRLLEEAVDAALASDADLLALPGDVTTDDAAGLERFEPLLRELRAPDGVVATLGNHDHRAGAARVRGVLERVGMRVLVNEAMVLERRGERLGIAGLDDALLGRPDLAAALAGVPASAPVVLLAHEPDTAPANLADPRVALQLSGHSHGGQVRIPFVEGRLGAPILPELGRVYPMGRYDLPGGTLYTSRGVGMSGLPIRFACPAEVALVRLERA